MKQIAVYGKGGIGKSTLSANISAALSLNNKRILQIGCDPKHDSTKLLMRGLSIPTVLDYIKTKSPLEYRKSDILFEGFGKIGCIEAGGPKPGVGCAGRGIITAFELLETLHIKDNYDMIVYDVLGDVVCGGFAVPIRREYSDSIFIVTSGEYMSLYAANNILRGIQNYDENRPRLLGILYNSRNVKNEDDRVYKFAEAVKLPVFARIPRDDIFARAEKANVTVLELTQNEKNPVADIFKGIAKRICEGTEHFAANPLTDDELEALILSNEGAITKASHSATSSPKQEEEDTFSCSCETAEPCEACTGISSGQEESTSDYDAPYLSKNVIRDEPLHGCAFNGAMTMSSNLKDAVILAHSPKSCTYLSIQTISSAGRRTLFERGNILPSSLIPNVLSTDMSETDMVFGGSENLLSKVKSVLNSQTPPPAIVIVSSCPSGIIGDDIDDALSLSTERTKIVTVKAEGNLTGDYLQGMLMAYTSLAKQIIDRNVEKREKTVNIVFEKVVARNTEMNFQRLKTFLTRMNISVNCRFLCNTSYASLRDFCSAELNLLAYRDYTGKILEDFFIKEYGASFFEKQFPIGFKETSDWLLALGKHFDASDEAKSIISENEIIYQNRIKSVRPKLEGKKLMIITYNHELDWILNAALDCDMKIVKICVLNFSQDEGFRSSLSEIDGIEVVENYDKDERSSDIKRLKPDIILSNYEPVSEQSCITDTIPMCPDNGFFTGLEMVERWSRLFSKSKEGEWLNDRKLFDKYYSR
ncbi:MAG: AAA family ATPase [[Eubacterium] sulci]|jgi:putative nitrogenase subunit nifH|nr:AAA family ATPase [[Eubacterium] sulci]MBF1150975.1 AAA family ATPase [[Eubacterium] sulci]MBF1188088.1 AAA family ATPase [[Eubacterium] sulci]